MEKFSSPLRRLTAAISEVLSSPRPLRLVRRIQALLITVTLLVITIVITYPVWNERGPDLRAGGPFDANKVAQETIVARVSVDFPRLDQYEDSKTIAIAAVPLHFERNLNSITGPDGKSLQLLLQEEFAGIVKCREKAKTEPAFLACTRALPGLSKVREPRVIVYADRAKIIAKAVECAHLIFENSLIVSKSPAEFDAQATTAPNLLVRDLAPNKPDTFKSLPFEAVILKDQIGQAKSRELFSEVVKPAAPDPVLRTAILDWILPLIVSLDAMRFLPDETEKARKEAVARIDIPHMRIAEGEPIVRAGEIIRPENRTALEVHQRLHLREKAKRIAAICIQNFLLLLLLVFFAYRFELKRMSDVTSNLVFFLNIWLFCGVLFLIETFWHESGVSTQTEIFGSWVPIGIFAVLFAILSGELIALAGSIFLSLLVFGVSQYDPQSFLHCFVLSLAAVWCGVRIQKRIHFLAASVFLTLLAGLLLTAGWLYENRAIISQTGGDLLTLEYKKALQMTLFSAMSTAFVIVILPIYESVFNVPTRFRLQELSDSSNPLLQEFYRLAPSTWNHTLMVASLTEKACERLGLNTLLARTGVYYHDIGKMKRAGFFVENQHLIPRPENIDKNDPEKAARVIIDHVLDGLAIAKKIRLPREVMAFIPEHHGTSTMSFFYHQALEKSKRRIKRENFRYPGPRPQSKETGIVMIADSLEAASRSLDEVTESSIEALIQKIMNMKLAEDQLDESGLTMGDLTVIRQAFSDVLLSSFHHRPRYPAMEATKRLEEARKATPRS
ncbi:MAG: HDIG domain-containing protein [Leptospirales bacterium]|nr:HDIG domain-containing protein [Leptospirales bacterium]